MKDLSLPSSPEPLHRKETDCSNWYQKKNLVIGNRLKCFAKCKWYLEPNTPHSIKSFLSSYSSKKCLSPRVCPTLLPPKLCLHCNSRYSHTCSTSPTGTSIHSNPVSPILRPTQLWTVSFSLHLTSCLGLRYSCFFGGFVMQRDQPRVWSLRYNATKKKVYFPL